MSTKSSPRAPQRSRAASPNRRERTSDLRAAGASAAPTFKPIHTRRTFEEICERIREQLGATDVILWNSAGVAVASAGTSLLELAPDEAARACAAVWADLTA